MAAAAAALVAVALGAVPALLAGGPSSLALVAVAALSMLLRARSHRFMADVLPPAAGAAFALLALEVAVIVRLAADPALVVALLAGTGLALVATAAVWQALPSNVVPARAGWLLVDLLLLPLTLGALGVFGATARLVHHLAGT
jgi:hypothetical protein